MELLCPSCQQRLSIPDQYAGQLMKCPLCNNTFTAPSLQTIPAAPAAASPPPAPPPPPPAPAPPPPAPAPLGPAQLPAIMEGIAPLSFAPESPSAPAAASQDNGTVPFMPAAPEMPVTDYQRFCTVWISPRIVPWIPPVGMVLIFILSFLPWASSLSAWGLSFGTFGNAFFAMFLILAILGTLASIASLLMTLKVIPDVPALSALDQWRHVITGGIIFLAFLCFFVKYLEMVFHAAPMSIWIRLAFCTHFLVVIACFLEFWLTIRGPSKPMPRIEMHW